MTKIISDLAALYFTVINNFKYIQFTIVKFDNYTKKNKKKNRDMF